MNRKNCIGSVCVFSALSAIMMISLLLLANQVEQNKMEAAILPVGTIRVCALLMLGISVLTTSVSLLKQKIYDDFQFIQACRWRNLSRSVALLLAMVCCLIGILRNDFATTVIGIFVVVWIVLLVEVLAEIKMIFKR